MKTKAIHCSTLAISVGLAVGMSSVANAADTITLRVADSFPTGHYIPDALTKPFMEEVERKTNNAVKFEYYPGQQLGKAKDMLSLTRSGVADIAYVAPSFDSDKMP